MEECNLSSTDSNEEVTMFPVETDEYTGTGTLKPCNECHLWFPTETSLKRHQCTSINPLKMVDDPEGQINANNSCDVDLVAADMRSASKSLSSDGFECRDEHVGEGSSDANIKQVDANDDPELVTEDDTREDDLPGVSKEQVFTDKSNVTHVTEMRTASHVQIKQEMSTIDVVTPEATSLSNEAAAARSHANETVTIQFKQEISSGVISPQSNEADDNRPVGNQVQNVDLNPLNSDPGTPAAMVQRTKTEDNKHPRNASKNYYKCSKCTPTRAFASAKTLQTHHTRCHVQVLGHSCHNCGHHFRQAVEKAKSIRTVYTQTDREGWMCEVCCKELSSFDEIERHKSISHNADSKLKSPHDRFVCTYCTKTFQFQCQLHNHELVHTGRKPYKCPHCPKSFRLKGQLETHVNLHTKQTIYSCGECGANFYQATTLHHHLRSKHQEWKFKCRFCQKNHVTKTDMLEHERIHTGVKPYICEECGAGFPRKQNLNNHLRAHRNERPFQCSTCGKAFFRKSTLKEHFRTHTGEKPYQCQRCSKRFTQKAHLRAHLRSHLRQELERHQPVNAGKTANEQSRDSGPKMEVKIPNKEDSANIVANSGLNNERQQPVNACETVNEQNDGSGSKVIHVKAPNKDGSANIVANSGLNNETRLCETTTVGCVVYVQNDNCDSSGLLTADGSVENVVILEASFENQN